MISEGKPFESLEEVHKCVNRFIASHFHKANQPHAIISIPADFSRDDDLRLSDHVDRQWNTVEKFNHAKSLIKEWASKQGHDRCWFYPEIFGQLVELFGIDIPSPSLPTREEFEQGCKRYADQQFNPQTPQSKE